MDHRPIPTIIAEKTTADRAIAEQQKIVERCENELRMIQSAVATALKKPVVIRRGI